MCFSHGQTKKKDLGQITKVLVRETGLEPVRDYHTPLKRARLPIPPLSRVLIYYTTEFMFCQHFFKKFLYYFLIKVLVDG